MIQALSVIVAVIEWTVMVFQIQRIRACSTVNYKLLTVSTF